MTEWEITVGSQERSREKGNTSACRITAITSAFQADDVSSILTTRLFYRGVAQPGSASGLGPEGRRFESYHPDQSIMIRDCLIKTACYAAGVAMVGALIVLPYIVKQNK